MTSTAEYYSRHRYPKEIISRCVWYYHRFKLSLRDIEEMMQERGIIVSYETLRKWSTKFGQLYANEIKKRRVSRCDKWHLDEVCLTIKGKKSWLWRAVDANGFELDILVQSKKNEWAARKFFRKLFKTNPFPRVIVTDKLPSYQAGLKKFGIQGIDHRQHKDLNNRCENSHQPTRQKEKQMRKFKSAGHAQSLLYRKGKIDNLFQSGRYNSPANMKREKLNYAFLTWQYIGQSLSASNKF